MRPEKGGGNQSGGGFTSSLSGGDTPVAVDPTEDFLFDSGQAPRRDDQWEGLEEDPNLRREGKG